MALQAVYKQFLTAPSSSAFAKDASLHYVNTTTSYSGASDIAKHLDLLRNHMTKKKEEFLSVVEGSNAIAVEVETTIEFTLSGGPYLPVLDDNFLTDRTVHIPIVHIVHFDSEGKIKQIRQSWDQGALLKQLDVIGKTGRNWPIRDSKDQINLIARCVKEAGGSASTDQSNEVPVRSGTESTKALCDPHASFSLFAPRDELESHPAPVVSPYAGSRPRQRDFTEILGDPPTNDLPQPVISPYAGKKPHQRHFAEILGDGALDEQSESSGREQCPNKVVAPKAGSSKKFQPNRLFDADENFEAPDTPDKIKSPERHIRPDPSKYRHFDFADGTDPQDAPKPGLAFDQTPKSRHDSQWNFEDFVTPQKPVATKGFHRAQDVRHWGTENDTIEETPARKVQLVKPRRDVETHFEFRDDGLTGVESRLPGRHRGESYNSGIGLYKNNLHDEDGSAPAAASYDTVLGNITNIKNRRKDFDTHFALTDESPNLAADAAEVADTRAKISDDRKKAVHMMESNWSAYDESPLSQKENSNPDVKNGERGIVTAGDGMGGRKGAGRGWGIGDESDDEPVAAIPAKKTNATKKAANSIWDF